MAAATWRLLPGMPASPLVRYMRVTLWPFLTSCTIVPPHPLSGSSGCPPTTMIFFLTALSLADNSDGRDSIPRLPALFLMNRRLEFIDCDLFKNKFNGNDNVIFFYACLSVNDIFYLSYK